MSTMNFEDGQDAAGMQAEEFSRSIREVEKSLDELTEKEDWDYTERRKEDRKKIILNKTFLAEIHADRVIKGYIYVIDISNQGLKVITDIDLPDDRPFLMKLFIPEPVELTSEVIWQKKVLGYMNAVGLRVIVQEKLTRENIEQFMTKYSIDTSQKIIHPNRQLSFQCKKDGRWESFYAFLLTISLEGMEITTDYLLPSGEALILRCDLEAGRPPLEEKVTYEFRGDLPTGRDKGWFGFTELSEQNRLRLLEFMNRFLQVKTAPGAKAAPRVTPVLEDFTIDF
ncbi:MAG: PilZ domain-containing protein [Candidatus Eremiobacteraeota bacterium]|nr:PilZ domain-containing protein [Candidatus Eremiobacteraeota bacterium]